MRKLLFVAALTAGFPMNAVADDIKPTPRALTNTGQAALATEVQDLTIQDLGSVDTTGASVPAVLTLREAEPLAEGPVYGLDLESFEKAPSLLLFETGGKPRADRQGDGDTHLAFKSDEGDEGLLPHKGAEPREIKIGTIGKPETHKTVADFKLSGPNAVEVTFSFFF